MAWSTIWQKNEVIVKKTTHYSMICGAISVHGTRRLHIAQKTISQLNYVEMLEERLFRQVSDFLTITSFFRQMVLHAILEKCQ